MEVSCSNCPARYAVPDAKVRGRKVRIQCKRCKAAIVVDGTGLAAGDAKREPAKAEVPAPAPAPAKAASVAAAPGGKPKQLEAAPRPRMDSGWREPGAVNAPGPKVPGAGMGARPRSAMKRTMIGGLGGPGADAEPQAPEAPEAPPAPEPKAPAAEAKPSPSPDPERPKPTPSPAPALSAPRPDAAPPRPDAAPRARSAIKKTMIGIPPPAAPAPQRPEPEPEPELPPIAEVEPSAPEPPRPGMAAEWTVAITDDQHEELTTSEVVELYVRGGIDFETFIWAEGMDDWKQPWEIPLLAIQLRQRGLLPPGEGEQIIPSTDFDNEDEHTVVAQGPAFARADPSGAWHEPGGWQEQGEADIGFEDVTVSMDAPHAAMLLRNTDPEDVTMDADVDELLDGARPAGTPYAGGYDSIPAAHVESDFADDSYDLTDQMVRPEGLGEAPYPSPRAPEERQPISAGDIMDFHVPQPPSPPVSAPFEYPAASAPQPYPASGAASYPQNPQFAAPQASAPPATQPKPGGRGGGGLFILVIVLILLLCAVAVAYVTRQPPQLWDRLPF